MNHLSFSLKLTAVLSITMAVVSISTQAASPAKSTIKKKSIAAVAEVKVNRTVPNVTPPAAKPSFSETPTDNELFQARVFDEPLVPYGTPTSGVENQSLAHSIMIYLDAGGGENVEPFLGFLKDHPQSPWRGSILTNLGIVYRRTGYFSRALDAWGEAWKQTKSATNGNAKATADRALGELAELNARLGRYDTLDKLFVESEGRDVRGSASEKMVAARSGLWMMRSHPEKAFQCGPFALDRIINHAQGSDPYLQKLSDSPSSMTGFSLAQVNNLSAEVGLKMRMARRGAGSEPVFPAVVNWKAGHYAALLEARNGRYRIQDPTFGGDLWITRRALDDESSGYFLIPDAPLLPGWAAVDAVEGGTVWGRGYTQANNPENFKPCDQKEGGGKCPGCRMASYSFHSLLVSLNITDAPVGYSPPIGPAVQFQVTYNQRESIQSTMPRYSNLGNKWTFDFLSYLVDDPGNPLADVKVYISGGGQETYTGFNTQTNTYAPHMESRATIFRLPVGEANSSIVHYERRFPDGSYDIFSQPDGAATTPRKVFLTGRVDSHGNAVSLFYDSLFRITSIRDAIGQVTLLSYAGDDTKIIAVEDPFHRIAHFDYNNLGQLIRITDVIGITSEFEYGTGDFIQAMVTPYGRTVFTTGLELPNGLDNGHDRIVWLEATDPLGGRERLEFDDNQPIVPTWAEPTPAGFNPSYFQYRNSFFWDKRAMASGPKDYAKAKLTHWLHFDQGLIYVSGIKESEKLPLERRVYYTYPTANGGNTNAFVGSMAQPSQVARILDDGTTTQLYQSEHSNTGAYAYNIFGKITSSTDPRGRKTKYDYDPNNDIDLLTIKQKNGTNDELLATFAYNGQHLPLTYTDASRRTTTLTYNARGQLLTVTNAKNEPTTYTYNGNGYLTDITGPNPEAVYHFTYDGYGRVRTTTDSDGYTLTADYDNLDRLTQVTYPDGTTEQIGYRRLDAETFKDRQNRNTEVLHDALRRVVASRDPLGRITTQQWCNCGSLENLIDPNGNVTHWDYDLQGRVTQETRANGKFTTYSYENTTSRLKSVTDAKLQTSTYAYLPDNRLQSITYATSQATQVQNVVDLVQQIKDIRRNHPADFQQQIALIKSQIKSSVATQTPSPVSFTYDLVYNRVATMSDGVGTTFYTYNPVNGSLGSGRLSTVDAPLSHITYSYDPLGRMLSREVNGATETRAYDNMGRITSKVNPLGTFGYIFNTPTSRLDELQFPNGVITDFNYQAVAEEPQNPDHRLLGISSGGPGGPVEIDHYRYSPSGNIVSWDNLVGSCSRLVPPNQDTCHGPAQRFSYDSADQLTGVTQTSSRNCQIAPGCTPKKPKTTVVKRTAYTYDKDGNRTSEQIDDYQATPPATSFTGASYGNTMNRLDSTQPAGLMTFAGTLSEPASVSVGAATNQAAGQWTGSFTTNWLVNTGANTVQIKATDNGSPANVTTNNYSVNVTGPTPADYAYDDNGNLLSDGTRIYEWDVENRLTAINQGTNRSEFVYDGFSRRVEIIEKQRGSTVSDHHFIWCGASICEERDSNNPTFLRRYYSEGILDNGQALLYHRDHLGSVREVTDDTGAIVARYDYDPFGRRTQTEGTFDAPNGYTGHYTHLTSGLVLTLYRVYDPNIGRWLSEDPIGLNSQQANFYSYAFNNPTRFIDALGLKVRKCFRPISPNDSWLGNQLGAAHEWITTDRFPGGRGLYPLDYINAPEEQGGYYSSPDVYVTPQDANMRDSSHYCVDVPDVNESCVNRLLEPTNSTSLIGTYQGKFSIVSNNCNQFVDNVLASCRIPPKPPPPSCQNASPAMSGNSRGPCQ
jgi:RHS repeat-associated protein